MIEQNKKKEESLSINNQRGMTRDEVEKLLTAPMGDRERAYFRGLYETYFRANELLQVNIEDYDRSAGVIVCLNPKRKYSRMTGKTISPPPKRMCVSRSEQILLTSIIGNRKKGPIFTNRQGKRLSVTYLEMYIDTIATKIGIQKVSHVTESGREYHLVTLQALREAGERHTDMSGKDPIITAKAAQHSMQVKEEHYGKYQWEEIQEHVKKHHPAFKDN